MKPEIDASLPIPLYHQLKEQVRWEISSGILGPGDQLPVERELEQRYGVSRMTVRQAMRDLVLEGLLVRQRGKGTFVTKPKIDQALQSAASFTHDMTFRGLVPSGRVLKFLEVPAPQEAAAALQVVPGTPLLYLERLRYVDGEPLALQWCYLLAARFPGLLSEDLHDKSLYTLLFSRYGVSITMIKRTIEGMMPDRWQAQTLQLSETVPLMRLGGLNFDQHGQPVEYGATLYRADKYKFVVEY